MLVTMLDYDSFVGSIAIGRIFQGKVKVGDSFCVLKPGAEVIKGKVTKILKYKGLMKVEAGEAMAGDIVSIAGADNINVGDTFTTNADEGPLPFVKIDEPTISMYFSHNTSPLAGKDGGKFLTSRHIRERLEHETKMNVGIRVEEVDGGERFKVSGRGELHLSILIETMRREGYELEVSRPKVIIKEVAGEKFEPIEELTVEVEPDYQGSVMEALGSRKAELKNMQTSAVGTIHLDYIIPSRALIGFRSEFLNMTRGTGIMFQNFHEYQKFKGEIPRRQQGVLVSQTDGKAVTYALWNLQDRGEIFVRPGEDLYEGMIIGVNNKGNDLIVNAVREKKLTNMRSSGADEAIQLIPQREINHEFSLEFIDDDELVEITPKNIRLRKIHLDEHVRKAAARGRSIR